MLLNEEGTSNKKKGGRAACRRLLAGVTTPGTRGGTGPGSGDGETGEKFEACVVNAIQGGKLCVSRGGMLISAASTLCAHIYVEESNGLVRLVFSVECFFWEIC